MTKSRFYHYLNNHAEVLQLVAETLTQGNKQKAQQLYLETVLKSVKELETWEEGNNFRHWVVSKMKELFYEKIEKK